MNNYEELAILTALQKAVKDRIAEVRAQADAEMREGYEDDGVVKRALKVGGVKVGDFIVTLTSESFVIEDMDKFSEFALDYGLAKLVPIIAPGCECEAIAIVQMVNPSLIENELNIKGDWQKAMTNRGGVAFYLDSNMAVPGVKVVPQNYKGTQLRGCKPDEVLPALRNALGDTSMEQFLLGGE